MKLACFCILACFLIQGNLAGVKKNDSPFIFPREYADESTVLTTATDDLYDFVVKPFIETRPLNTFTESYFKNSTRVLNKREAPPPGNTSIPPDFGATISRLLTHIRTNNGYDKRIRPNYRGKPVDVGVTLFVSGISRVSEVDMDVTLDFYFRQIWQDHRLDFRGLWSDELVIGGEFMKEIWRPDTFFVNAKLSSFHHVTTLNTFLRISPTGTVTQSLRLTVTASCPMDFTYFPMDSQRCSLEIESFGYTTKDIGFLWANWPKLASVRFSSEIQALPQFRVRGHREVRSEKVLSTGNYSRLVLDVYFERSLGYYIIQVYVPSSLIVFLSLISFWIDRNSPPARVALGITTVLTMTTLTSSTNANLPKISYLKAIDVYLVSCFIMVFSALLEYAAVTYTGKRCKMRSSKMEIRKTLVSQSAAATLVRERMKMTLSLDDIHEEESALEPAPCDYCHRVISKASDIEKYSRIIFPTAFISFSIFYWIIYLNVSIRTDEDGFIPVDES